MEQSGEPRLAVEIVLFMDQEGFHQQAMLGHRKGMWALGLAIPPGYPGSRSLSRPGRYSLANRCLAPNGRALCFKPTGLTWERAVSAR